MGAWIAIAGAGAFGMMLAAMVGTRLLAAPAPTVMASEPHAGRPRSEPTAPPSQPARAREPAPESVETVLDTQDVEGSVSAMRTGPRGPTVARTEEGENLTPEERALLERMASGGAGPRLNLDRPAQASASRTGEGLDEAALRRGIAANRPSLTRCYEQAIRGVGEVPSVRLDVQVAIGPSGTVTSVDVQGNDFNGLAGCIRSAVRRWRFEPSGAETRTSFPLVFHASR
ncbi:MAG: AgmX/PglI C-terminal domain-containing protein [Myxococcota bacterium]|nr:AgmX/PglI C-terminal domain-containing protein [Myxococcota bacterium]